MELVYGGNYECSNGYLLWRLDEAVPINQSGGIAHIVTRDLYDYPLVCARMHGKPRILK